MAEAGRSATPAASQDEHTRPAGTLARLASAGSWAGDTSRGRGWEDNLAQFLSALLFYGGLGWLLDRWLGTDPWIMIGGLVFGNMLGIYALWLRSEAAAEADRVAREAAIAARRSERAAARDAGARAAAGDAGEGGA